MRWSLFLFKLQTLIKKIAFYLFFVFFTIRKFMHRLKMVWYRGVCMFLAGMLFLTGGVPGLCIEAADSVNYWHSKNEFGAVDYQREQKIYQEARELVMEYEMQIFQEWMDRKVGQYKSKIKEMEDILSQYQKRIEREKRAAKELVAEKITGVKGVVSPKESEYVRQLEKYERMEEELKSLEERKEKGKVEGEVKTVKERPIKVERVEKMKRKKVMAKGIGGKREYKVERNKGFDKIVLDKGQRGQVLNLDLDEYVPLMVVFPEDVVQVSIVDENLISYEKVSPSELVFRAENGLGNTVVYVWDKLGRWILYITVIPPRIVKELEEQAKREQEQKEHVKFYYSNDWWGYYRGQDLGDVERNSYGFVQEFSLEGPTAWGNLAADLSLSRENGSYVTTYRFVSLKNVHKLGLQDGYIVFGNYFQSISPLTFSGTTLDGIYVSEDRDWISVKALYGETEDYWSYIPIVGLGNAKVWGFRVAGGDFAFNFSGRDNIYDDTGYRIASDEVMSIEMEKKIGDVVLSGEFGYDASGSHIAALLNADTKFLGWNTNVLFKDVEKDYKTIVGYPSYSGELGIEIDASKRAGDKYYRGFLNVYRDRAYPSSDNPHRWNVETTLSYDRSLEHSNYGMEFSVKDFRGTISPFRTYDFTLRYSYFSEWKDLPYVLSLSYSYGDNIDDLMDREYRINKVSLRGNLDLVPSLLSVYSMVETGVVYDKRGHRKVYPFVWDNGFHLGSDIGDSGWKYSVNAGYRYENKAEMPYSFSSDRDMLYVRGRLDWQLADDRWFFVEADLKRYYGQIGDTPLYLDMYAGMKWMWDTKLNLLPKTYIYGYVFEDSNLNGTLDKGEICLPNVEIYAGDLSVKTDENGYYELGWVKGEKVNIDMDSSTLPQGLFPVKDSKKVVVGKAKKQRVDFPVRYLTGLKLVAFVDTNNNGLYDRGEEVLSGVGIYINGEKVFTDSNGIIWKEVKEGNYRIKLDLVSLPANLVPVGKVEEALSVKKGRISSLPLAFRKVE